MQQLEDYLNDLDIDELETWVFLTWGGFLILRGLRRRSLTGLLLALTGAGMIYKAKTGERPIKAILG